LASFGYIVVCTFHDDEGKWFPGPLERRMKTIKKVLKYLVEINEGKSQPVNEDCSFLEGRMNFSFGVGILGHSFGGTTTSYLITDDHSQNHIPEIRCGVGLDAWLSSISDDIILNMRKNKPYMFVLADLWNGKNKKKI